VLLSKATASLMEVSQKARQRVPSNEGFSFRINSGSLAIFAAIRRAFS